MSEQRSATNEVVVLLYVCLNGCSWMSYNLDLLSLTSCSLCVCLLSLFSERTVCLLPPGTRLHNRNNEQLFRSVAVNQTTFTKAMDSRGSRLRDGSLFVPLSLLCWQHTTPKFLYDIHFLVHVGVTIVTSSEANGLDVVMTKVLWIHKIWSLFETKILLYTIETGNQ